MSAGWTIGLCGRMESAGNERNTLYIIECVADFIFAGAVVAELGGAVYLFAVAPPRHIFLPLRRLPDVREVQIGLGKWAYLQSFVGSYGVDAAQALVDVVRKEYINKYFAFVAVLVEQITGPE